MLDVEIISDHFMVGHTHYKKGTVAGFVDPIARHIVSNGDGVLKVIKDQTKEPIHKRRKTYKRRDVRSEK